MQIITATSKNNILVLKKINSKGSELLFNCNSLSDVIKELPDSSNDDKLVSRITMENEILKYNLRNKSDISIDELTKEDLEFVEITSLFDLYLLIMLNEK